jgi:hypothetical protein
MAAVVPGALQEMVDQLWTQIMRFYFPINLFVVEREPTVGGTRRKANIVVTNHNMNTIRNKI